jgi:dTDP-3-amino-3,4,6-trideoxy-alpha-D-glucose transaminase
VKIPFLDLARRVEALHDEALPAIERVLRSGRLLGGPETEAFEAEFATYCARRHAVAVSSGTNALSLTLRALGVGPGDEVIVPALTAVPTAAAVCAVGAVPVPVDVDRETAGLDPAAAEGAVTDRTRAVIVVHLYGRPMGLPSIGVPVIEDAAQAHGALASGAATVAAAYSFYPTKNLGGIGDGGAVVTDDPELAERVRLLRTHGLDHDYLHTEISGNARLSEIEAAWLRIALARLDGWNARRREIAHAFRAAASDLCWQSPDPRHVYHLCVGRVSKRDEFRKRMPFESAVHYPCPVHRQPAYEQFARRSCPEADAWATECVSIPCYPEMTTGEIEKVCGSLASYG